MGGRTGSVALQAFSMHREPGVALHVGGEMNRCDGRRCRPAAPPAAGPAPWVALHGAASLQELQLCSKQLLRSPRKRLRPSAWK